MPLLIGQGLLGGVTVLTELPGGVVALHLATAEALLAVCLLLMVASFRTPITPVAAPGARSGPAFAGRTGGDRYQRWALAGALSVYAVIITGALVTAMGATPACTTWPLCQGQAFPMHHLTAVHMFHRYVVLALGILLCYAVWRCARGPGRSKGLRRLAWATLAAFIVQIVVGAATVWLGFQPEWRALHLTAATAVWAAAAGMAIVAELDARAGAASGGRASGAPAAE